MAGQRQQRAKRPRIYGDENKARAALTRQTARGEELLSQAVGVRNRIDAAKTKAGTRASPSETSAPRTTETPPKDSLFRLVLRPLAPDEVDDVIARDWVGGLLSWSERTKRVMRDYLQEQFNDTLPTIMGGVPPQTGKPRHRVSLDNGEPWLREAVDELRQMQAPQAATRFAGSQNSSCCCELRIW